MTRTVSFPICTMDDRAHSFNSPPPPYESIEFDTGDHSDISTQLERPLHVPDWLERRNLCMLARITRSHELDGILPEVMQKFPLCSPGRKRFRHLDRHVGFRVYRGMDYEARTMDDGEIPVIGGPPFLLMFLSCPSVCTGPRSAVVCANTKTTKSITGS